MMMTERQSYIWRIVPSICLVVFTGHLHACSAWIDDFDVLENGDTQAQSVVIESDDDRDILETDTTDSTSSGDRDTDVAPPAFGTCNDETPKALDAPLPMCPIPASTTKLGCDDTIAAESCMPSELPQHDTFVSSFHIMKYETTNDQFSQFITANPSWAPDSETAQSRCKGTYLSDWYQESPLPEDSELPVTEVCWYAARAFCQWLGPEWDLPTEAQWETAARISSTPDTGYRLYPFGNDINCVLANHQHCGTGLVPPGTTEGESPAGVRDMAGNAMEWTLDWYRGSYYCDPENSGAFAYPNCNTAYSWSDPICEDSLLEKSLRGGSWYALPGELRNAARKSLSASSGSNLIGFRCVRLSL